MRVLFRGVRPRGTAVAVVYLTAALSALMAGGCSQHRAAYSEPNWYAGAPRQVAAVRPPPVEMEDDGRPGQIPPQRGVRRLPDDPREPWSPNYGGPAPSKAALVQPATPRPVQTGWATSVR